MTLLVDTSEFAGLPDYGWLREKGAEGVLPRLTSGETHVDKLIDEQIDAATAGGVPVLAGYHYLQSHLDGGRQAEHALREMLRRDLPALFLDVEPAPKPKPTDSPVLTRAVVHAFLRRWLELTGARCPVYGAASYLHSLTLDVTLVGALWVAQVGTGGAPREAPPMPVRPWGTSYLMHQYQHNAPGRPGGGAHVDWNRSPYTIEQIRAELAGVRWTAPTSVLGAVSTLSDRAAGRRPGGGPEDFEPNGDS